MVQSKKIRVCFKNNKKQHNFIIPMLLLLLCVIIIYCIYMLTNNKGDRNSINNKPQIKSKPNKKIELKPPVELSKPPVELSKPIKNIKNKRVIKINNREEKLSNTKVIKPIKNNPLSISKSSISCYYDNYNDDDEKCYIK